MSQWYPDVEQRRLAQGIVPFIEDDFPASFPYAVWSAKWIEYYYNWRLYTGQIWDELVPNDESGSDEPVLRFPLRISYEKSIADKYADALIGEVPDGPEPVIPIRVMPRVSPLDEGPTSDQKRMAMQDELFVNQVLMDNNGRALQQENVKICQILGGAVFKITWSPQTEYLEHGIKVEIIMPDFFMPVWDTTAPDHLLEAWVVWRMPAREASILYDFDLTEGAADPLFVEHWTCKTVNITLNGKPLRYKGSYIDSETMEVEDFDITYEDHPNIFGEVPFFYIPTERSGQFYGDSVIQPFGGLTREINARLADLGEIIRDSAHPNVYVKNVTTTRTIDLGGQRDAIDLGVTAPGMAEPTVDLISVPTLADPLVNYPTMLQDVLSRRSNIPGVAEGVDEGSQRSALTLAFRMWPLTARVRAQRTNWGAGTVRMAKFILKIGIMKELAGLTPAHAKNVNFYADFSPMIPRDREQIVNEIILALQQGILSPVTALAKLNMVNDPQAEYEKVQEHLEWLTKLQADAKAAAATDRTKASTGYNSN